MVEAELVKQAKMKIEKLPKDTLELVIAMLDKFQQVKNNNGKEVELSEADTAMKRRLPGGFDGDVIMADDFFDTPDCFKEYV